MDRLLSNKSLPPGFRFHPTDEELFMYYLKRKVMGKSLGPQMMSEVDVYRFPPWDLPAMSCLNTRDLNWYFLVPRSKKYPNGGRTNRATEHGYWKSTGNDRTVEYNHRPVGKIKTLIFHLGKAPKGDRTDWVMHEYRLEDKLLADKGVPQDSYVISKIYKKSGLGPKNGENYGAPFVEEEWESDDDDDDNVERENGLGHVLNPCNGTSSSPVDDTQIVATAAASTVSTAELVVHSHTASPSTAEQTEPMFVLSTEEDELDQLLSMFTEEDGTLADVIPDTDIFNGLEDFLELNDLEG